MLEYLGKGLGFPIKTNVRGGLQISVAERSVEESIQIILRTTPGERVYRPDFGSRLGELVFAPLNLQTLLLIQLSVREALEQWEPRILLEEVETDPDPVKGRVEITIIYRLISQPDLRSLVYPFYLLPASADSQS
jgi:uncharacterized protein